MTFQVIHSHDGDNARSPFRVIEQPTGREVEWVNRFLDRECVRRLAENTLRSYAMDLLHFLRWWTSMNHTDAISEEALSATVLLDYLRSQAGHHPQPAAATVNRRVGVVERALRDEYPDTASPVAPGFHHFYWRRSPLGYGRPRPALSRLRVKEPKRIVMPLSVDEVARFWSSFRTSRDLAIVGLMLLQGLRSKEVIALNCEDVLLSESQMRVRGKGNKIRPAVGFRYGPVTGPLPAPGTARGMWPAAVRLTARAGSRRAHDTRWIALPVPPSPPHQPNRPRPSPQF
jgi:integrase